jgi:small subunit ribosomal protein S6
LASGRQVWIGSAKVHRPIDRCFAAGAAQTGSGKAGSTHLRTYESIIIFHPEATEEARQEIQDKVRGAIERVGGQVQTVDDWGKRKLAYPVRKHRYGQMARFQLEAEPKVVSEMDQIFRHAESVIKYMTTVMPDRLLKQKAAEAAPMSPVALDSAENGRRKR